MVTTLRVPTGTELVLRSARPDLDQLSADQLRALAAELFNRVENKERTLVHCDALTKKPAHELAIL